MRYHVALVRMQVLAACSHGCSCGGLAELCTTDACYSVLNADFVYCSTSGFLMLLMIGSACPRCLELPTKQFEQLQESSDSIKRKRPHHQK